MACRTTSRYAAFPVLAAILTAGCSTMTDVAGVPHPGYQSDGSYVLLTSEQELDCRAASDEIELGLADMAKAKAGIDKERTQPPTTMVAVYGRMFGGPDGGLKNAAQYRKAETRIRALDRAMLAKGCPPFPLEERVAAISVTPTQANAANDKAP